MITTIRMDVKISRLWLLYFFISIAIVGLLIAYIICIPLYLLGIIYKPAADLADLVLQKGIFILMWAQPWLNCEVHISLPPKQNSQGLLLFSNHRSTLDVYILLSRIPGIRVFAKSILFYVPFLNIMMFAARQIYVPQNKLDGLFKALKVVKKKLRRGETIHIFPEMTRCPRGFKGLQPFSLAPFSVAIEEKALIIPIVFIGTDQVWPKGHFGLFTGNPVKVKSLEPISAKNFANATELRAEVQNKISTALQNV